MTTFETPCIARRGRPMSVTDAIELPPPSGDSSTRTPFPGVSSQPEREGRGDRHRERPPEPPPSPSSSGALVLDERREGRSRCPPYGSKDAERVVGTGRR
jgi:hypothetical protein